MIPQIQFPVHANHGIAVAAVSSSVSSRRGMFANGSASMGDSTRSIGLPSSSADLDTTTSGSILMMDHSHPQHHEQDEPASKRQKPPRRQSLEHLQLPQRVELQLQQPLSHDEAHLSTKKKKRVSFAAAVPLGDIHSTQWSLDELQRRGVWYSQDELLRLKNDRKSFVKALKRVRYNVPQLLQLQHQYLQKHPHKRQSSGIHTARGFEAYFSVAINHEYKSKRKAAIHVVLQEQTRRREEQWNRGGGCDVVLDDTAVEAARLRLQQVSLEATQWARDIAIRLGREDAEVALALAQEEEPVVDNSDDLSEVTMHSSGSSSPAIQQRRQVRVREQLQEAPLPPLSDISK